jgi:hypothetical protein
MLSKEVFNEAKFTRVNICTKRNIDETNLKQPKVYRKIYTSLLILNLSSKKISEPKVSRLLPNLCDLQKSHTLGYGFKIHRKSIR